MISFATWDALDAEGRVALLNDVCGGSSRDSECHALVSTDRAALERFVAGITNVIGVFEGTAAGTGEDGDYPARGKPGSFYARYRECQEIERGPGINIATPKEALEVCGEWAGGTPPGTQMRRRRVRVENNRKRA